MAELACIGDVCIITLAGAQPNVSCLRIQMRTAADRHDKCYACRNCSPLLVTSIALAHWIVTSVSIQTILPCGATLILRYSTVQRGERSCRTLSRSVGRLAPIRYLELFCKLFKV